MLSRLLRPVVFYLTSPLYSEAFLVPKCLPLQKLTSEARNSQALDTTIVLIVSLALEGPPGSSLLIYPRPCATNGALVARVNANL
jgi:hypothetical protein